jgi:hypothetical protein
MSLPQSQRGLPTRMGSWLLAGKWAPIPFTKVNYGSTHQLLHYVIDPQEFDIAIGAITYTGVILGSFGSTLPTISVGTHTVGTGKLAYPASILVATNIPAAVAVGSENRFDVTAMAATWKNPANAVQTIQIGSGQAGRTYRLAFNGSEKAVAIDSECSASALEANLATLSTIGVGGCSVARSGSTGSYLYTVTFIGKLGNTDHPLLVATDQATCTTTIAETVQGHPTPPMDYRGFPYIPKHTSVVVTFALATTGGSNTGAVQGNILWRPIE